jgi:hypothetical protein
MDVLILLAAVGFGALGAPVHVVLILAAVLTGLSARRKIAIANTYPDVGASRVLAGALFLSLANNAVFSLLSFLLGRVVVLLF